MNQHNRIEIIDRNGWRKEFPIEKTIVHIGSNPRNDVVLAPGRGGGVAPLHAQLIASTSDVGCQLVNLGDTDILLGPSGDQALPPRSTANIVSGTVFKLGEFILVFYGDEGPARDSIRSSHNIGLSVSLPQARLAPNRSLDGVVMVSNLGDRGGVQFNLELEGLEPDCYDIEPGPILSSGVEKELFFHLYHRGTRPSAGDYYITIRATAPYGYPGEQATASKVVHVLPFYHHKLRLVSPAGVGPSPRVGERQVPGTPPSQVEDWWMPTPPTTNLPVATERAPRAKAAAPPKSSLASLPAQVEKEQAPEAETVPPAPIEDEWALAAQVGPQPQAEERRVLKLKASPPPETEEQALEAETSPPPPDEDWWGPEAEAKAEEQQVLKLKASPPPETEEQALEAETSPPPPDEDWWTPSQAEEEPAAEK